MKIGNRLSIGDGGGEHEKSPNGNAFKLEAGDTTLQKEENACRLEAGDKLPLNEYALEGELHTRFGDNDKSLSDA